MRHCIHTGVLHLPSPTPDLQFFVKFRGTWYLSLKNENWQSSLYVIFSKGKKQLKEDKTGGS